MTWTTARRVTKQLIREFSIPIAIAACWTAYKFLDAAPGERARFSVLDTFAARVFFFSWLIGQVFRVAKHHGIEDTLANIDRRVDESMSRLDLRSQEIMRTLTGGESYLIHHLSINRNGTIESQFVVSGHDVIVDLSVRVWAIDSFVYDESNPGQVRYVPLGSALSEEVVPVLHPMGVHSGQTFEAPRGTQFDLLVQLRAKNTNRDVFYRFKHFPDSPIRWVERTIDFTPGGGPPTIRNAFCTDGPWEEVRPLTDEEFAARAAKKAR